jgi:hypothetical protein
MNSAKGEEVKKKLMTRKEERKKNIKEKNNSILTNRKIFLAWCDGV